VAVTDFRNFLNRLLISYFQWFTRCVNSPKGSFWYEGLIHSESKYMKKSEIARRIATQSGVSAGEAADRLDRMVEQILSNLRQGKETSFPGLGKFTQGPGGQVAFVPHGGKRRA
jgi:hypothetical protein